MSTKPNDGPAVVQRPRRGLSALLQVLVAIPTAILPVLPSGTCPLCVAGDFGVLSGLGAALMLGAKVRTPLVVVFVAATLAWVATRRGTLGPFIVALSGSLVIVAANLIWNAPLVGYVGAASLVVGALWNVTHRSPSA